MGCAQGESCCHTVQACIMSCPCVAAALRSPIKADLRVLRVRLTGSPCKPHSLVGNKLSFQLACQPQGSKMCKSCLQAELSSLSCVAPEKLPACWSA